MRKQTLKPDQPPFEIVDGPLAGKRFVRGTEYNSSEIPKELAHRFVMTPEKKKAPAVSVGTKHKEQTNAIDPGNP